MNHPSTESSAFTQSISTTTTSVLDGFTLLEACRVEIPDQAERCTHRGAGVNTIVAEDASYFTQLRYVDFAENELTLESLAAFPNLEEASLACNGVRSIPKILKNDFTSLQKLDLSYNLILSEDILHLSQITLLEHLNLSYNDLKEVPPGMGSFAKLKHLNLSHNKIASDFALVVLSEVPRLKELNLCNNRLTSFQCPAVSEPQAFHSLEVLDVGGNRIGTDNCLLDFTTKLRFREMFIYGNPCCNDEAFLTRMLKSIPPQVKLTLISPSAIVHHRPTQHQFYEDTTMIRLDTTYMPTAAQWRTLGLQKMHQQESLQLSDAPAIPEAKEGDVTGTPRSPGGDGFFLTQADEDADEPDTSLETVFELEKREEGAKSPRRSENSLRQAIVALRYTLNNPLTSTNDYENVVKRPHHQQLKDINKQRAIPKRPYVPIHKRSYAKRNGAPRHLKSKHSKDGGGASRSRLENIESILDNIDQANGDTVAGQNQRDKAMEQLSSMVNSIISKFEAEE